LSIHYKRYDKKNAAVQPWHLRIYKLLDKCFSIILRALKLLIFIKFVYVKDFNSIQLHYITVYRKFM